MDSLQASLSSSEGKRQILDETLRHSLANQTLLNKDNDELRVKLSNVTSHRDTLLDEVANLTDTIKKLRANLDAHYNYSLFMKFLVALLSGLLGMLRSFISQKLT